MGMSQLKVMYAFF